MGRVVDKTCTEDILMSVVFATFPSFCKIINYSRGREIKQMQLSGRMGANAFKRNVDGVSYPNGDGR